MNMQTQTPLFPPSSPFSSRRKKKYVPPNRRAKRFSPLAMIGAAVTLLVVLGAGTYFVILPRFLSHAANTPLPGQRIWKGGASSLVFGSNDPTFNSATSQSLRLSLRQAGITLVRTPLANNGGSEVEQRLTQIQDIGATCLGILTMHDMALDQQIVKQAGNRCQLYEFGNEPDNPGSNAMSVSAYAQQWNQTIPILRQIAPQAKFVGPAVASPNLGYISAFLQATQANAPDAVTYHMYPCTDVGVQTCLTQSVNSYASAAQQVRNTVTQVLGRTLPLGVTEWNDNWRDQAKPEESDPTFISQFTTRSLQSLMQGQVAFANQYNFGTGTGDGHLFLTANGQPKPQLQAMANMIVQTKLGTSANPVPTGTSGVASPVASRTPLPASSPTVSSAKPQTATKLNCTINGQFIQNCTGSVIINGQSCTLTLKGNTVAMTCPQKEHQE